MSTARRRMTSRRRMTTVAAAVSSGSLPLVFQRTLTRGIAVGAVK